MTRALTLTTYAIGLLLLAAPGAEACGYFGSDFGIMPTGEAIDWSFTVGSQAAEVTSRTVEAKVAPAPKGTVLVTASAAKDKDVEQREIAGERLLDLGDAGAVHVTVRPEDGALSIAFPTLPGSEFFVERFRIPAWPTDGLEWTGEQVFLSCGFGVAPASFSATREQITVPGGTFNALKVEAKHTPSGQVFERIWLRDGVGIVKLETGCGTWELQSPRKPKPAQPSE